MNFVIVLIAAVLVSLYAQQTPKCKDGVTSNQSLCSNPFYSQLCAVGYKEIQQGLSNVLFGSSPLYYYYRFPVPDLYGISFGVNMGNSTMSPNQGIVTRMYKQYTLNNNRSQKAQFQEIALQIESHANGGFIGTPSGGAVHIGRGQDCQVQILMLVVQRFIMVNGKLAAIPNQSPSIEVTLAFFSFGGSSIEMVGEILIVLILGCCCCCLGGCAFCIYRRMKNKQIDNQRHTLAQEMEQTPVPNQGSQNFGTN